ncbi:MAG TPA: TIR domain-containing protein [Ktedonobacteraceae bacterium]|nr:TIR domain-containing protein [Ktedonobacteraceae bacterium]
MGEPGIFVSYYAVNKLHPDYSFAVRCMRDLRMRGAEIVAESSLVPQGAANRYLEEQLSRCQWLILILTPEALRSRQVQMEVETVLKLVRQQRLQGILALMPMPCSLDALPPGWSAIRIFDASEDYARALARIGLILNLVRLQAPAPAVLPSRVKPSIAEMIRQPFERHRKSSALQTFPSLANLRSGRGLFAALAVPLVLLVTFTSILIAHGRPGTISSPTIRPTPTVLSTDPAQLFTYVTHLSPALKDELSIQDANRWDDTGGCAFKNGIYDVSIQANYSYTNCLEHFKTFSNFAYQVQMQIVSGDAGGLLFRANNVLTGFYRFSLDAAHQNYNLLVCKTCNPQQNFAGQDVLQPSTSSISVQLNKTYSLTVIANKNLLYLYVNGQFLFSISNPTFQSGELGLYAYEFTNSTEVEFSNMKVWVL